ncbi:hypothetical protein BEH_11640 [Priestia filamentosa]|uniref:Uncharacterized protein n=1 Tax=Priestia filamentosa TaxID=1402861 RepID=A0A0H4KWJ3_9BACI|nr:hypothetical protein [Priestia filamentosa]AKO92688.1 hypothetical protein BEH_11640 [Priestia filamentosa]
MKVPKHIVDKLARINKNAFENRELMYEVESWLNKKGIDTNLLRKAGFSILEAVEYGELSPDKEKLKQDLIDDIEDFPRIKKNFN